MTVPDGSLMNGDHDFSVSLDLDFSALAPMRHEVGGWLGSHGLATVTVDDLLLVLSELCTNAIEASTSGDPPVLVRVHRTDATISLEVENSGAAFEEALDKQQKRTDPSRGRGLIIVRALADEVAMQFHDGRCIVRAVLSLA